VPCLRAGLPSISALWRRRVAESFDAVLSLISVAEASYGFEVAESALLVCDASAHQQIRCALWSGMCTRSELEVHDERPEKNRLWNKI